MRFSETTGISHLFSATERELRQKLDEALAELGLTYPQYAALSSLESKPSISNADLARTGTVTAQTMNRIISNLESMGLVKRSKDPSHRLKQILKLSKKGADAVCEAHILVDRVERQMIRAISLSDLQKLLEKCRENLAKKNLG